MAGNLIIRFLKSSLISDYLDELKLLGIDPSNTNIAEKINPNLTFKVSSISPTGLKVLTDILLNNNIPFWKSKLSTSNQIVFSMPTWTALEKLFSMKIRSLLNFQKEFKRIIENRKETNWIYNSRNCEIELENPKIMGILNVTPDSFSDGGKYLSIENACKHAENMIKEGVDIIDIGAESTRPGASKIDLKEEWKRIAPVLKNIRNMTEIPLSIDTYKAEIAYRSLNDGADIINDISGLMFDKEMINVVAKAGCPIVVMHIKGNPRNMQINPHYDNLMEEIFLFFKKQIQFTKSRGIKQIIIDPGIGFGKRYEDNFEIIRRLSEFQCLGYPILVGPSRKSFIGKCLNTDIDDRIVGSAIAVAEAVRNGARIVRVHDVKKMKQAILLAESINNLKISDK
jgi:dihydropteroate synthase